MARRYWLLGLLCFLLCMAGGAVGGVYYLTAVRLYRAQVVVAAPNDRGDQALKVDLTLLPGLGGSGGGSDTHTQFLFQLTSYETAGRLLGDRDAIVRLRANKRLRGNSIDTVRGYVSENLEVKQPRLTFLAKSPFSILSLDDPDPKLAARILGQLMRSTDDIIRNRRLAELAAQRTEILRTLPGVTTAEYRDSLVRLLAQVERERIFAKVNPTYSYRIVDPLNISSGPVSPRLLINIGIGFFAGAALAFLIAVALLLRVTIQAPSDE